MRELGPFKEQGITIVSILTAVGMAIGILVDALLGGPSVSATTNMSGSSSGGDKKSGAREWIKKQIKSSIATTRKISWQSISIATRNYRFNNFMDFEKS